MNVSERPFEGRSVVLTGAGRGIGEAIAVAFAESGANVGLNDLNGAALESVASRCRDAGADVCVVPGDVSEPAVTGRLVVDTVDAFGRLDVAVPNAAFSRREPFLAADDAGFRKTIDVTMWGAFHLVRAACRAFVEAGRGGAVVAVSSPHAYRPTPHAMAYNMAKAAVEQMCRTAATELIDENIRINCVRPGWTDTPGERAMYADAEIDAAGRRSPRGRLARVEEIARAVLFLADPRNEYVNGTELLVDGGQQLPIEDRRRQTR